MISIQLWQKYKSKPTQGLNFLNWVEINYPDINIRGFYDIFIIENFILCNLMLFSFDQS